MKLTTGPRRPFGEPIHDVEVGLRDGAISYERVAASGEAILLNKTLFVTLSLALTGFAGTAVADWTCGDIGMGYLDTCTGDTNSDNPYAACDGEWRDLFEANTGTYVQSCNDGAQHLYVCPNSYSYSYQHPSCQAVTV